MKHWFPVSVFGLVVLAPVTSAAPDQQLSPTAHPVLPASASQLWLVPSENDRSARALDLYDSLVLGVQKYIDGDYAAALPLVSAPSLASTALSGYAVYYTGLAQLRLSRFDDARKSFESLRDRKPQGYLGMAAALADGEAAEGAGDHAAAAAIYAKLAADKLTVNEDVLTRLGRASLAAGDGKAATEAYLRVYYEFALTDAAKDAAQQLEPLKPHIVKTGYKADLGRALMLFGAKRYTEARTAFDAVQSQVEGDDKELVALRIGECDFFLKRYEAAREAMRPYLETASRKAEAKFFYLSSLRDLGQHDEYVRLTHALVQEFPDSSWSEEALNNLGTHYILNNEDALAADVFEQLYEKFPNGPRAERAAWKAGWWAYRNGEYATTARIFESAASAFSRSDYRPSFLYWASRSHAKLGAPAESEARMRLVFTDYGNSYYGRLAERQLARRGGAVPVTLPASHVVPVSSASRPPTEITVRLLLANGLYDDALNELRYAQRAWGTSPVLDATIAWAYHQKGELRRAITLMRRAYPQHLTASGDDLPPEILRIIFPLTYWELIRKHSARHGLDPYLVAALIAQESTFDPKIRSVANAWGLMQIVPATGRRLARSLGIRRFTTSMLTSPETNIRLGTLYFSRLIKQFGGTYYALASYNAGESRIVRWKAERPGLDEDEFIDDIPFPETQNYVKRILGTAEDYRTLYGRSGLSPIPAARRPSAAPAAPKTPAAKSKTTPAKKPAAKGRPSGG
jgi:soluble lytic murein transglycosylase